MGIYSYMGINGGGGVNFTFIFEEVFTASSSLLLHPSSGSEEGGAHGSRALLSHGRKIGDNISYLVTTAQLTITKGDCLRIEAYKR